MLRWLRSYVATDILNMDVVTSLADLSHSRVTDSDLIYLLAFPPQPRDQPVRHPDRQWRTHSPQQEGKFGAWLST